MLNSFLALICKRLHQSTATKRNVPNYRGQLFRLNFQRLISPASTTTILTVTFFGNEISCAHIEVYLKKFFSHTGVSQVFNALGASFLNINTNNIKEPCLAKGVCEPRIAFWKGLFYYQWSHTKQHH